MIILICCEDFKKVRNFPNSIVPNGIRKFEKIKTILKVLMSILKWNHFIKSYKNFFIKSIKIYK